MRFLPISALSFAFLAAVSPAWSQSSGNRLTLSGVANSPDALLAERVLTEAYARLGFEVEVQFSSAKESLMASNAGLYDGELQRIDGISSNYSNLIQISIPINFIHGAVFSLDDNVSIEGWHQLRPYRVGIVKGVIFAEEGTRDIKPRVIGSYAELFGLLRDREVDIVVAPLVNGLLELNAEAQSAKIFLSGILETLLLYHYLHEDRKCLVPEITRVLKEMLLSGRISELREENMASLKAGVKP